MNPREPKCIPPERLESLIRSDGAPPLIDLRSPGPFRKSHVVGSVSIPSGTLDRSLYLLPPRGRPLLILARSGGDAARAARWLLDKGWHSILYLDGSPAEIDSGLRRSGAEPNRLWEPSSFLCTVEPQLPREARVLDLACGSGRDAVFLALAGHEVLGVDRLPDALAQARRLARAALIDRPGRVSFRQIDLTDRIARTPLLRPGRFDTITCFRYLDRDLLPFLSQALAPGGLLIYQTFLEEQRRRHGKPSNPAYLLAPGELRNAFPKMKVLHYEEGEDEAGNILASFFGQRHGRQISD